MASYSVGNYTQKNNTFLLTLSASSINNWVLANIPPYSTINSVTLTFSAQKAFSAASGSISIKIGGTQAHYSNNVVKSNGWYNANYSLKDYVQSGNANAGQISGDVEIFIDGPWTSLNWTVNNVTITYDYAVAICNITAYAEPKEGGTVKGAGSYQYGSSATLTALPRAGYRFVKWTYWFETEESTDNPLNITVNRSDSYYARFEKIPPPEFTSASMIYLGKQISETNKVPCGEGFILSVGLKE